MDHQSIVSEIWSYGVSFAPLICPTDSIDCDVDNILLIMNDYTFSTVEARSYTMGNLSPFGWLYRLAITIQGSSINRLRDRELWCKFCPTDLSN